MKDSIVKNLRIILPAPLFAKLFETYHYSLSLLGALLYGFPSRKLFVIAVTGTKGKSTTVELIRAILSEAGHKTAATSTVRFCIGGECESNLFKMTMPGRFFLQHFLRRASDAGCTHAVIEMTSEGASQFRHKEIVLDALVFTNLAPEHIESHGNFENYAEAKLSLMHHLEESPKRPRYIVANLDDAYGEKFLQAQVEVRAPFSLTLARPYQADESGARFLWRRELITSPLPGLFNLKNTLAAFALCEALGIPLATMRKAAEKTKAVSGRAEKVERGQKFTVIVDYAHTPDSLKAIYETFKGRRICVLGSTGGGRDTWRRAAAGKLADEFCDVAYLTDEDPYDEDPKKIIEEVAAGFSRLKPNIVLDRRLAIRAALREASLGDTVIITGKGTDPFIMRAGGAKEPWSDRRVAEEELDKLLQA